MVARDTFPTLGIYQNALWTGPCPGPRWQSSQRSPDLLAALDGHFQAERANEDKKGEGNE